MVRCVGAFLRPCPVMVPADGRILCNGCWRVVEAASEVPGEGLAADALWLTDAGWEAANGQTIIRDVPREAAG